VAARSKSLKSQETGEKSGSSETRIGGREADGSGLAARLHLLSHCTSAFCSGIRFP